MKTEEELQQNGNGKGNLVRGKDEKKRIREE